MSDCGLNAHHVITRCNQSGRIIVIVRERGPRILSQTDAGMFHLEPGDILARILVLQAYKIGIEGENRQERLKSHAPITRISP